MKDGQHYILKLLGEHGPLTQEAILQFASDDGLLGAVDYIKGCLESCKEDGLVRERDGVVSLPPIVCPCCGSEETTPYEETREYTPPFGETTHYQIGFIRCAACKEGWCAKGHGDSIRAAIRQADLASVRSMLDDMLKVGLEPTAIARMLRLPMEVVQRWNSGTATPAEIVVLRLVRAFPTILTAAADDYTLKARTDALVEMLRIINATLRDAAGQ